jgi:hypothetical protein
MVENLAAHIMSSFFVFSYVSSRYMEIICRSGVINQSVYFIFQKSISRHTPYGYRNGQEIHIQVIEVICTTYNVTHLYKNRLKNKININSIIMKIRCIAISVVNTVSIPVPNYKIYPIYSGKALLMSKYNMYR